MDRTDKNALFIDCLFAKANTYKAGTIRESIFISYYRYMICNIFEL